MSALDGTVALVTGASSGIGEATAEALAAEGASLALLARRADRLTDLASRLNSTKTLTIEADVTDEDPRHDPAALRRDRAPAGN